MSKDKLTDYDSTTASNNTDVGGISVAEGMLPSAVNNSIRELTKQLGAFADGTDGIDVLSLADDDASHAIKLQAPSAVTADTTFTLPDGDGVSGQTMITDGAGALSWAAPYGNRNLIINSAMQVAQRGTSHTQSPNSGNYHTVDRFSYRRTGTWSGVTAVALSQESSGAPSGFTHFLRYAPTGSDSSTPSDTAMYIEAKLEGNSVSSLALGTSAAKSFTVSFYVRSSVTGTFSVSFHNNASPRFSYVAEYTINSANTWERKEVTVDAPTSGTFDTGTSTGLVFAFIVSADSSSSTYGTSTVGSWLSSTDARWSSNQSDGVTTSANQTFDITGIQLEVGSATPFEHRSYADELVRCQRYCFAQARYGDGNIAEDAGGSTRLRSARHSANASFVFYQYPVMMRANPDLTFTDNSSGTITDYSNAGTAHLYDSGDTAWHLYDLIAEAEL